jgi:hypothetical protein
MTDGFTFQVDLTSIDACADDVVVQLELPTVNQEGRPVASGDATTRLPHRL